MILRGARLRWLSRHPLGALYGLHPARCPALALPRAVQLSGMHAAVALRTTCQHRCRGTSPACRADPSTACAAASHASTNEVHAQVLLNRQRRSTDGWDVRQVVLDALGGVLSLLQVCTNGDTMLLHYVWQEPMHLIADCVHKSMQRLCVCTACRRLCLLLSNQCPRLCH